MKSVLAALACAFALAATSAQGATVDLSAEASRAVANDQAEAVVFAEDTGPSAEVAQKINQRIAQALALGKRYSSVRLQSAGTNTYPVYGKNRRIDAWRMRSTLRLESTDTAALSELLGKLQQDLAVESVGMAPSRASRGAAEKDLLVEAVAAFRAKAKIVAEALGGSYRIKSMSIGSNGMAPPIRPVMAMRAMAAEAAPMPLEAGDSTLTVQVSGQIEVGD